MTSLSSRSTIARLSPGRENDPGLFENKNKFLSAHDLALVLNISVNTVRAWRKKYQIGQKIGGVVRYRLEEVLRALASRS